ncbi:CHAT domain-containing protein [Streptomyces sp. NPDC092952]|uniref:CHAT domain-containing protein n=1 Tax=Streptomyces sp. NPDC092952 TaxID=3366018 RepID=UPI0037F23FF7
MAFVMLVDGRPWAGLAVSDAYRPQGGLLHRALLDGLQEMWSVVDSVGDGRVLPGWGVVAGTEPGELRVVSPRNPEFVHDLCPERPDGWTEAARARGTVLLAVVHSLAWERAVEELPAVAEAGLVVGGPVGFDRVVRAPEAGQDGPVVRVLDDPVGQLLHLAQFVNDGVLSLGEAVGRVAGLKEFRDATGAVALDDEEMFDRLLGASAVEPGTEVRGTYAYTRMITELAVLYGGPGRCGAWDRAARLTVESAVRALSVQGDMELFRDADAVSRQLVERYRREGPGAGLVSVLVSAARLRVVMSAPVDRAGDAYAEAEPHMTACREARWERLRREPSSRGLHGELDRIALLAEAVELLAEAEGPAAGTTGGPAPARALIALARTGREIGPEDALEAVRATDDEDARIADTLALCRLVPGDSGVRLASLIFERDAPALSPGGPGAGALRDLVSRGIAVARAAGDGPLLARVLQWADALGGDDDQAYRRQVLEARLHGPGSARVPCPAEGADGAAEAELVALAHRLRDAGAETYEEDLAHLAAHVRAAGLADLGQRLLIDHEPVWRRSAAGLLASADLHALAGAAGSATEHFPDREAHHLWAAAAYAELGLLDLAGACLAAFRSWLTGTEGPVLFRALLVLVRTAPSLQGSQDPEFAAAVREVAHSAVWQAVRHVEHVPLVLLLAVLHAAKGAESALWYGGEPLRDRSGTIGALLGRIADAESGPASGAAESPEPAASRAPADLLAALESDPAEPGRTGAEIARNLRRFTDRVIDGMLLRANRADRPVDVVGSLGRLLGDRELLDERTVLLATFLPEPETVPGDVVVIALTRDRSAVHIVVPDGYPQVHWSARKLVADEVRRVRDGVAADPLFLDVAPDGWDELSATACFLGDQRDFARWREQGKDRLIVWPHGPFHYFPLHLCPMDGRPLADDWTVTAIPSLTALLPSAPYTRPPRTAVIASARGGTGFGLAAEEPLEEHARRVAATVGVPAVVGADATRGRLLGELATADVVHIAAHGTPDSAAPWFHCLYLSPDRDDDGRVFAHDLLGVDLRGVRLVTLAACDSALGRFDLNDNLRGIPGALLAAGAGAVVGCLWPVRPEPAMAFFSHLHGDLGRGAGVVGAFRAAQLATRAQYPQYRDWGTFSLIQARNATA